MGKTRRKSPYGKKLGKCLASKYARRLSARDRMKLCHEMIREAHSVGM